HREAPFTPPWHMKQPGGLAVRPGTVDTPEFGRTTTSFEGLPPLPPQQAAPPPPPPPPEDTYGPAEEPWQAEEEPWPVEEPTAAPEEPEWDDAPREPAPSRPQHVRMASGPYGTGWAGIDAHGRRRVTHERRDARPVIDRRARPRTTTTHRSNELPLSNLVTGSLVALACLIVTGFLVHTLL
ncbi:MAG: hypothetical protein ACYTF8_12690, partial [Planctomycetota bacterium]